MAGEPVVGLLVREDALEDAVAADGHVTRGNVRGSDEYRERGDAERPAAPDVDDGEQAHGEQREVDCQQHSDQAPVHDPGGPDRGNCNRSHQKCRRDAEEDEPSPSRPRVQLPGAGQQERKEARDDASAGTACHCSSVRLALYGGRYPPSVSSRAWTAALAALVGLRVAIPLVTLAASGHDLPGLPPYDYKPLNGDAAGFYAEARELISAAFGPAGAGAALILGAGAWAAWRLRPRWTAIVAAALAVSLAASLLVLATEPAGAAVVGWPLLWAIPLLPLRAAGVLDADLAFAAGFAISLAANAVTVVAIAHAGCRASGRRTVGVAAAALFAVWPLLTRPLAGPSAWENGQWNVDVGLHLYTEPLSTALVAVALALLLAPRLDELRLALAGALLGYATVVRVSNGFLALAAVALVAYRLGPRRALPLAAAGAAFIPLVAVYWPKGYPEIPNVPGFSLDQAGRSWADSLIFDPRLLLVLLPLAVLGLFALRPWASALLGASVATNALFYTFYEHTHIHPRFLYASLPALFVLEAAGGWLVIRKGSGNVRKLGL